MGYEKFKGKTVVFVGERATTGEPNRLTGRLSNWGYYHVFNKRKDAKEFMDDWERKNPGKLADMGSAKAMRKYSLGCTVENYLEDLDYRCE